MIASVWMMSLGLLAPPKTEAPEVRILESVEWLCLRADRVLVGQITSAVDLEGGGKSRGLMSFDLKGADLAHPQHTGAHGLAIRDVTLETLNGLRDAETRLAVFVRHTLQSFSYGGRTFDSWPLRGEDGGHWVVPVGVSDAPLVSAQSLTVVSDPTELARICAASPPRPMAPDFSEPQRAYLPVPSTAPMAKALGDRAPAYLVVPAAAFPAAPTTKPGAP